MEKYQFRDGHVFAKVEQPAFIVDRLPGGGVCRVAYGERRELEKILPIYEKALGCRMVDAPKNQEQLDRLFQSTGAFSSYYEVVLDKEDGVGVDTIQLEEEEIVYRSSEGKKFVLSKIGMLYSMYIDKKDMRLKEFLSSSFKRLLLFEIMYLEMGYNESLVKKTIQECYSKDLFVSKFLENATKFYNEKYGTKLTVGEFKRKHTVPTIYGYMYSGDKLSDSSYGENKIFG